MKFKNLAVLVCAATLTLTGCGAKYDQKALEKKVAEDWRHCSRVHPERVVIEAGNKNTVRYSYVLKVVVDGVTPGYTCYVPDVKMLEALANKSIYQIKAGEEISVTQEISQ